MLVEIQRTDRAVVYELADGAKLVVPHAPDVPEVHELAKTVAATLDAFANLDGARRAAAADANLSDVGRVEKLAPQRQQVARQVAQAKATIEESRAHLDAFQARTFAVPAVDPADAATGLADWELRDYLRGLQGKDQAKAFDEIASNPRLMQAVLRSPIPIQPFTDLARKSWAEHVEKTHPDAAKVTNFRTAHDWAAVIIPQLEKHVR